MTGLLYQRITDIVAFIICSTLLTIYVIQHYFTAKNEPDNARITQPEIRLVRLNKQKMNFHDFFKGSIDYHNCFQHLFHSVSIFSHSIV